MNYKNKNILEEIATKLTGIEPIKDYEYQRMTYEKRRENHGKGIQKRKEFFKRSKGII